MSDDHVVDTDGLSSLLSVTSLATGGSSQPSAELSQSVGAGKRETTLGQVDRDKEGEKGEEEKGEEEESLIDIAPLILGAGACLSEGSMCVGEGFTLREVISAVEIGDPRVDSGAAEPVAFKGHVRETYPCEPLAAVSELASSPSLFLQWATHVSTLVAAHQLGDSLPQTVWTTYPVAAYALTGVLPQDPLVATVSSLVSHLSTLAHTIVVSAPRSVIDEEDWIAEAMIPLGTLTKGECIDGDEGKNTDGGQGENTDGGEAKNTDDEGKNTDGGEGTDGAVERPDFDDGSAYVLWHCSSLQGDFDGQGEGKGDGDGKKGAEKRDAGKKGPENDREEAARAFWEVHGHLSRRGLFKSLDRATDTLAMVEGSLARIDAAIEIADTSDGKNHAEAMRVLLGDTAPPPADNSDGKNGSTGGGKGSKTTESFVAGAKNSSTSSSSSSFAEPTVGLGASRDIIPEMMLSSIPSDPTEAIAGLPALRSLLGQIRDWLVVLFEMTCAMACAPAIGASALGGVFDDAEISRLALGHYTRASEAWARIRDKGIPSPEPLPSPLANPGAHLVSLTPYTPRRLPALSVDEAAEVFERLLCGGGYAFATELGEPDVEKWSLPAVARHQKASEDKRADAIAPAYSGKLSFNPTGFRSLMRRVSSLPPMSMPAPYPRALLARLADPHFANPCWVPMALAGEAAITLHAESLGKLPVNRAKDSPMPPLTPWAEAALSAMAAAEGREDVDVNDKLENLWMAFPAPVQDHFYHMAHLHHLIAHALLGNPARTRRKVVKMMALFGMGQQGSPTPLSTLATLSPVLVRALLLTVTLDLTGTRRTRFGDGLVASGDPLGTDAAPGDVDAEEGIVWWWIAHLARYGVETLTFTCAPDSPELMYLRAMHFACKGLSLFHALLVREGYIGPREIPYGSRDLRLSHRYGFLSHLRYPPAPRPEDLPIIVAAQIEGESRESVLLEIGKWMKVARTVCARAAESSPPYPFARELAALSKLAAGCAVSAMVFSRRDASSPGRFVADRTAHPQLPIYKVV